MILRKLRNGLLLLVLPMLTTGCELMSKTPVSVTDTYCRVYEPVCMSHKDTEGTINQVTENEVVFKRLCPNEAAAGDRKCRDMKP